MSVNTTPVYLAAAGSLAIYVVVTAFILPYFSQSSAWVRKQPWTGLKKQWFSGVRAGFDSVFGTRGMLADGYEKFSRQKKLFALPQLTGEPMMILSPEHVHEFLSAGDSRVDHQSIGRESIGMKYTIPGNMFPSDDHFSVVRRQLTRKLPLLTSDVYTELVLGMEDQWPVKSKEWTTVNVYPTCMKIVSRAANRVFSGAVLCRNPEYLESSRLYAQSVFGAGMMLRLTPKFLHPIAGPIVTRPVRKHLAICKRISVPVIEERLREMERLGKDYNPPNDVLQWVLDDIMEGGPAMAHRKNSDWICRCLLLLNMVAIHTTSMVTANTLMDLYSSPNKDDFVAGLREEGTRVLKESGGEWSKDAVNNLIRVDSTIRETMRQTGLGDLGIPRIVSDPKGVELSGGLWLPQGVRVAVPAHEIHNDERFYPNARQWDAFRFSRPREEYTSQIAQQPTGEQKAHLEKILELKNKSLVTTDDTFFSFGFGKHACPGRFFASQEIKLMIAHVVMTYDIEMLSKGRPDNMHINSASVPRDNVQMRIRSRQH